ncbi:MAG: aspartate aminotransferase family protein [Gammaproteobacteria bacterium]|nr:MAG: aspartate aminotransferase family protein [Gammaproteobacteria bacterium]
MHARLNLSTAELQALDAAHYLHPFTDYKQLSNKGARIISHADGIYLWDSDGNRILDAMAGLWCVNIGYGREELARAAAEQMRDLPYYNSFFQTSHEPGIRLAEMLSEVTPEGLDHVFYSGSGSEANDTVVRMVRHYWGCKGKPEKTVIISRENAYHGSTMAGASLGGMKPMHAQGGLPIPGIVHIEQPYWFENSAGLSRREYGVKAARALEHKLDQLGDDKVAAFIAEPIQGAGGVIIPPDSYWPEIKRILDERDILLVMDEVICGFGRTGEWFGSDLYDIRPDLMPMAKGMSSGYLPIGGVMVSDRVVETLWEGGEFFHGYTYSGHPTCCAVAIKNIEILQDENIVEHVRDVAAPHLAERWEALADHPLVGEARSAGLVAALELVKDKATGERFPEVGTTGSLCRDICIDNGIIMRAVRDSMIISPPLIISASQIDELVDLAWRCLDQTASELGVSA